MLQGAVETEHAGFGGDGYANSENAEGASISWQVAAPASQTVALQLRYANGGSSARTATLSVNGNSSATVSFVAGAWNVWQTVSVNLNLPSGSNTITLRSDAAEGLANIDALSLTGTGLSVAACPLPPPEPAVMATDAWFVLVNRASGLVLDIDRSITEQGAALTQWTRNDAANQLFRFVGSGNNYYRMVVQHSGLALDLFNAETADGADIVQWQDLNVEHQQFQLLNLNNGYYQIVNRVSGKALAPENNSTVAATRVSQYARSTAPAQQWQVVRVAAYTPDTGNPGSGACGSGTPKARVTGSPGSYLMNGVSYGNDYRGAIAAALAALTSGRTQQERVSVMASGDVGDARINLQSNTVFEVCGTMNAAPSARGTITIWGAATQNVSIPYLKMTGNPTFAILISDTRNLHLGQIDLRLNGGGGIRFDNRGATADVQIDNVYVEGTSGHGVETWNIDGLTIGAVTARSTGYAGLLLNNTRNAAIGTVDGNNTGAGTGYATLRFANTNGQINGAWPTNITVDRVVSRGGARGIFCVSNSGGVTINSIDLANNGSNSILLENCHNFRINGGTINGGGELRLSARSEFPNTSDVTIANVRVSNTSVRESPCGDNINFNNVTVTGGSYNVCN